MKRMILLCAVLMIGVAYTVCAEKVTLNYKPAKLAKFYAAYTNGAIAEFGPGFNKASLTNAEMVLQKVVARVIAEIITRGDEIQASKAKPEVIPTSAKEVEP